jgi:hypothetical protein
VIEWRGEEQEFRKEQRRNESHGKNETVESE